MITLFLSGIATALTSIYINYYTDSTNFQPNSQNRESIAECQFLSQEMTSSSSIVRSTAAILFYFTCVTKAVARSQSISTDGRDSHLFPLGADIAIEFLFVYLFNISQQQLF